MSDIKRERNKMKVLLYTSGSIFRENMTGGEKRFIELAHFLAKPDIKINDRRIESGFCCADTAKALYKQGLNAKFHMKKACRIWFFPPEAVRFLTNLDVLHRIKKEKYDAVIVFDVPAAIGLCLYGVQNIVLMIRKDMIGYEIVGLDGRVTLSKKLKLLMQWASESVCLRRASVIVCQCQYDKNVLLNRHRLLAERIKRKFRIQINNVNPSWVVQKSNLYANDDEGKAEAKDSFKVCFIGGFDDPRKGQELFLDAASDIIRDGIDMQFILIGGGKHLDAYKEKYRMPGIIFKGRMENPITELKKTDLLVVPSLADSCPNTVVEGMYNGIPVIGSRAGGIPELLKDDSALFELDASMLKEKIMELYRNPDSIQELRRKQNRRRKELEFYWPEAIMGKATRGMRL